MSRFVLVAVLACVVGSSVIGSARAQTSDDKDKAARLAEAVAACDRGAAVPLDPDAKAPPVEFADLRSATLDDTKLRAVVSACAEAKEGAPNEKRLQLQWLRAELALGRLDAKALVPPLRTLADAGSAEARYLMFEVFSRHRVRPQDSALGISRIEALSDLAKAAGAGHQSAMADLSRQYLQGPLYRREIRKAVEWAQRFADAPPQGREPGLHEAERRGDAKLFILRTTLEKEGFSPAEQTAAFAVATEATHAGTTGEGSLIRAYIAALRFGRGTQKDAAKARQMLEARAAADSRAVPMLAAMLAAGEGGPADGKRAIALLREKRERFVSEAGPLLAGFLLDGRFVGRQPQEAIAVLQRSFDIDAQIRLAGLLVNYHPRLRNDRVVVDVLTDAAHVDEPGALMALVHLKLSDNSQFSDVDGARRLLQPLAERRPGCFGADCCDPIRGARLDQLSAAPPQRRLER